MMKGGKMSKESRYSAEEKFLILKEAEEQGVVKTCSKHGIDPTTYYFWKERYESEGITGLLPKAPGPKIERKELKDLQKENEMLKKLLAEKEVLLEAQRDLLKKKRLRPQK